MTNEKNIIHGEKIEIDLNSTGLLLHNALKHNSNAVIFIDAFSHKTVTNEGLFYNTCRLADSMKNYGLCKNDVIGVFTENSLEFFEPVISALYLGVTVTLFNNNYITDELKHAANLSQPKVIFCSKDTVPTALTTIDLLNVVPKLIVLNSDEDYKGCQSVHNFILSNVTQNFNVDTIQPIQVNVKEHGSFIMYSSGTTGLAKGAILTHFNVNACIAIIMKTVTAETRTLIGLMPFYHVYGLFLGFLTIIGNEKLIIMKKFQPHAYLKSIQNYKINNLHIVPYIAHFLAKSEVVDKYDLSSIKRILCGGSPLSKTVQEILVKRLNIANIRQAYGLTESTVGVLTNKPNAYIYGSCGSVLPNTSVKIINVDTGEALGPMEVGELCCRGATLMKGYVNDPGSTRKAIDNEGWLHTGDVAYYNKDGLFFIVDRLKELIKYNSLQVAPAELEAILLTHPYILDAGVIGIPDDKCGELPFAFVVRHANSNLTEDEVKDFIGGKVSSHKRLRGGVQFVQEIPRNPSGKILRRILRERMPSIKSKL